MGSRRPCADAAPVQGKRIEMKQQRTYKGLSLTGPPSSGARRHLDDVLRNRSLHVILLQ